MDFDELAELRHLEHAEEDDGEACEWCGQYEPHCHCEEQSGN